MGAHLNNNLCGVVCYCGECVTMRLPEQVHKFRMLRNLSIINRCMCNGEGVVSGHLSVLVIVKVLFVLQFVCIW